MTPAPSTTTDRLRVSDLAIGYREPLHAHLTFHVGAGDVLGIVGPSGCGKSTLLATIAGLIEPLHGQIAIDGTDVTTSAAHTRRCPMVFQDPLLFTNLNVLDNVAYGARRHGASRAVARERAAELLQWVGLSSELRTRVDTLSGGQAQRVSLARALAAEPVVLLLDEPFSALDAPLRRRLADDVRQIVATRGLAAVHVTHDRDEADRMCTEILELPG
jgi:ABC-type Fe3+/spermidine/putrescine transport system ATPase subunit